MKINWKVRIKNKAFWIAIIPAIMLLIQQVCSVFGVAMDFSWLSEKLISIVGTVFIILTMLGVVADPTTEGMSDSATAMTYEEPKGCDK